MEILIGIRTDIDPILVEHLVQLPEAIIHLSLSHEDTLRILSEAKPDVLITDLASTPQGLLETLSATKRDLDIYLYENNEAKPGNYRLTRFGSKSCSGPDVLALSEYPFLSPVPTGTGQFEKVKINHHN